MLYFFYKINIEAIKKLEFCFALFADKGCIKTEAVESILYEELYCRHMWNSMYGTNTGT